MASGQNLLGSRRATSASDGVFQILGLPPGPYTLRASRIGFATLVIDSIRVRLGKMEGLGSFQLQPTTAQLSEVRIAARSVTLDPARTTIGATLEATDLASLPADRDYKSVLPTLAHVNTSYNGDPVNAAGSTGLENMYFIDGVNVTSPLNAATATSMPTNFIRTMEVRAGGYEAQYGKALGAIVNAVTYTGTNDFESSVFGFFTHDAFAMDPRAQPQMSETGSMSYDVGARVSGPVVRNRLWFSAALNPRAETANRVVTGHGTFVDRRQALIVAGKMTWQPSDIQHVELSVFGDPTTHQQVAEMPAFGTLTPANPDPFLRKLDAGGITLALKSSRTISAWLTIDASLSTVNGRERTAALTQRGRAEPFMADYVLDSISGGFPFPEDVSLNRTTGTLRATFARSAHTVVVGSEYEINRVSRSFDAVGGGMIFRNNPDWYLVDSQASSGVFRNRVPTLYAQDAWRLNDRVTLNLGVRWSGQFLISPSGATAQRLPDEWQPRVGFSWQLGPGSIERVFGSYGRFYQQEPLNMASLWYVDYYATSKHYSVDPRRPGAIPDSVVNGFTSEADWARSIEDIAAENFDEFTLGYERVMSAARVTLRAMHRRLRSSFQFGFGPGLVPVLGTPGEGDFGFLPPPRRNYTALEIGLDGRWTGVDYRTSYVLSRSWGNYSGLFFSDGYIGNPGWDPLESTCRHASLSIL